MDMSLLHTTLDELIFEIALVVIELICINDLIDTLCQEQFVIVLFLL